MKKTLYVFAWACGALLAMPAAAQVPSYVPTDGLVGWWPFNGNANDESGNGNDGVVNGATLTEDRLGNNNNAYNFDGIANKIQFNLNSINNIFPSESETTTSIWVKTSDLNGPIISMQGNNSNYDFHLGTLADVVQSPGNYGILVRDNCCGIGNNIFGGNISDSAWHMLTIVRFSDGTLQLYLDGILDVTSASGQNGILTFNPLTMTFGADESWIIGSQNGCNSCNSVDQQHFNGLLDDIAIYNRALTEQEIQNLYTGTTPAPCASLPSNLQQGLVGYWPFCGNANDESGNGNDGTVNGATLTEDRFGNAGSAYGFDGVDDNIIISNSFDIAEKSINCWVRPQVISETVNQILGIDNAELQFGANVFRAINTGGLNIVGVTGAATVNSFIETSIELNAWQMLTMVKNISSTQFYFNGELVGSIASGNYHSINGPLAMVIGSGRNSDEYWFNGDIDDLAIFNRALTPEEVQELYTLDACTFTVYDTSYVTVYDTLTTYETVYDTLYTYETIYDTVTTYVTVTDTLLIDITFVGFEGQPSWLNTVTVFPNPASDHITIDYGNFALMAGYNTVITDAAGATVYSSAVNSQQAYIDINAWGATGVYYMTIYDASGAPVAVRHIVLE